jgi:hypothetical protein
LSNARYIETLAAYDEFRRLLEPCAVPVEAVLQVQQVLVIRKLMEEDRFWGMWSTSSQAACHAKLLCSYRTSQLARQHAHLLQVSSTSRLFHDNASGLHSADRCRASCAALHSCWILVRCQSHKAPRVEDLTKRAVNTSLSFQDRHQTRPIRVRCLERDHCRYAKQP